MEAHNAEGRNLNELVNDEDFVYKAIMMNKDKEEAWEMQGDCMAVTYPPMDCWPDPESAPLETASSASKET